MDTRQRLFAALSLALAFQGVLCHNNYGVAEGRYNADIDKLSYGSVSRTSLYYPTNLDKSNSLQEGHRHYYDLKASLCTTALIDRVQGNLEGDKYEQLYLMVELWDLGSQKGDALLSMKEYGKPSVHYDEENGNWTQSPGTHADFSSHNLFLRYHKLTVPVDVEKVVECIRSRTTEKCDSTLWVASIYNAEFWTRLTMVYHIKATCTYPSEMPCERTFGPTAEECNGKGLCVKPKETVQYDMNKQLVDPATGMGKSSSDFWQAAATFMSDEATQDSTRQDSYSQVTVFDNTYNQTLCQCEAFYGNTGCQTTVFELKEGEWRYEVGLSTDQWRYYRYMTQKSSFSNLRTRKYLKIELKRTQGDTILFAKNILDGSIVNGLPHLMDYQTRSDKDSFRNRQDYHYIILDDIDNEYDNQIYYIAVLNNNAQIKMDAKYHIRVQEIILPANGTLGVCGNDCGGLASGECHRRPEGDVCVCNEDYAGQLCEGFLEKLPPQQTYSGMLSAGEIHYYKMEIASDKNMKHYSMSDGFLGPIKWDLIIEFYKDGGQVVVMGNYHDTPSIHSNDFVYTFGVQDENANTTAQNTMLTRPEMEKGVYYIAVFNHNYQNTATVCSYSIRVSLVSNVNLIYGPYIPVVLGVLVAMFLLLLTGVCWKFALRHTSIGKILFNNSTVNARSFSLDALGNPNRNTADLSRDDRRGLSKESINQRPEIKYTLPAGTTDGGDDEPVCSICLSEFRSGDILKRIPNCNHEFHKACIEQWLYQHTSCPMCRVEIMAPPSLEQTPLPHSPQSSPELGEDEGTSTSSGSTSSSGRSTSSSSRPHRVMSIGPPQRPIQERDMAVELQPVVRSMVP